MNLFPIFTRVFSKTISQDLVSVQPLSGPTGKLFYMDNSDDIERIQREEKLKRRQEIIEKILKHDKKDI